MNAMVDRVAQRAAERPLVGGLPDLPGIISAIMLSEPLGGALRAMADVLLVAPFCGATLSRGERELLATAVSTGNSCVFCSHSHAAFAEELLRAEGEEPELAAAVAEGRFDVLPRKLATLVAIALVVREDPRSLIADDVVRASDAGATDADIQLAILISAAFCMFNRIVDGFRATTPADPDFYRAQAHRIATYGYVGAASPAGSA